MGEPSATMYIATTGILSLGLDLKARRTYRFVERDGSLNLMARWTSRLLGPNGSMDLTVRRTEIQVYNQASLMSIWSRVLGLSFYERGSLILSEKPYTESALGSSLVASVQVWDSLSASCFSSVYSFIFAIIFLMIFKILGGSHFFNFVRCLSFSFCSYWCCVVFTLKHLCENCVI